MPNVRLCDDRNEILNSLYELQAEDCKVTFWSNSKGNTAVDSALITEVDPESNIIYLSVPDKYLPTDDTATTIYLKGAYQSLLFRDDHITVDREIAIHIPNVVRVLEKRLEPRHHYGLESDFFVNLQKNINGRSKLNTFELSLFDLSPSGMALNLSADEAKLFELGESFEISKIGNINFMIPIRVQVQYFGKMEFQEHGVSIERIKLGCHFDRRLSDVTLDTMESTSGTKAKD